MIRRRAVLDTDNPPGQIVNPAGEFIPIKYPEEPTDNTLVVLTDEERQKLVTWGDN